MKRFIITLLLLAGCCAAGAQGLYLTDRFRPVDSKKYEAVPSNGSVSMSLAAFPYKGGFTLSAGGGGLIADDVDGYAVFHLGGDYEKLSFVVAPGSKSEPRSASDDGHTIMTVKGDGRILADDVIRVHDAPKEYVLDVRGVGELSFRNYKGDISLAFGEVRLWSAGQTPVPARDPQAGTLPAGKVKLGTQLKPYFIRHGGWVALITGDGSWNRSHKESSISINRHEYTSGLQFTADQAFMGHNTAWAYFWLQKKYDKVSFIIGPRDNQSSNANGWLTVKGDGKILYERLIGQNELAEQIVLDVRGVNQLSFDSIDEGSDFLGGLTFGVVDIFAYKAGDASVPPPGVVNANKDKVSRLPDATRLASSIQPFSVRGVGKYNDTYFNGESSHYTFSMGGEKFSEGFVLTTGNTLFDDNISSYASFDLAGEFDWVTFTVGTLTNHRVLDEDRIMVYADDRLMLDVDVHCTWPNQVFSLPLGKCRVLKFVKPGTGKKKQTYIGVGDIMVFRGEPQDTAPYFYHPKPDFPETADLIDLCGRPYFHYVGRFLSSLTNFDFNDCFKNGSSQREFFQMKDGSKIYKGVMLETNIPPAFTFEDISLQEALFIFLTGAGSSISSSAGGAVTGVTAGAALGGALAGGFAALNLVDDHRQSSAAAFNPYGQYETLTFTVANKSAFVDTDILGARQDPDNPVKLSVFADLRKVGEFWLTNSMQPTTFTLPIHKCTQLMFWMECGESRSGQYVLYDMTVSKTPLQNASLPVADQPASTASAAAGDTVRPSSVAAPSGKNKGKKEKKAKERVVWKHPSRGSRVAAIDQLVSDTDELWALTAECIERAQAQNYRVTETYLQSQSGGIFKAVSLVNAAGERLNIREVIQYNKDISQTASSIQLKIATALIGVPAATLGIASLEGDNLFEFPKVVRLAPKALNQCRSDLSGLISAKETENDGLKLLLDNAVDVGTVASTDYVLIHRLAPGEAAPDGNTLQRLEYYR